MEKRNLTDLLKGNPYPGRGIVLGKSADGRSAIAVYFIMGRSDNSRNRVFTPTEDGIRTEAHDPSKMTDPSLIIYHPVRKPDQSRTDLPALKVGGPDGGVYELFEERKAEAQPESFGIHGSAGGYACRQQPVGGSQNGKRELCKRKSGTDRDKFEEEFRAAPRRRGKRGIGHEDQCH